MNDNSLQTIGDRVYVNPNVAVGETNSFIDNLRQVQAQDNQQIAEQTHALGSDLPSSMGGLSGSGGIWRSRYQTPQVESAIQGLRATTQAEALSQLLSNELAQKQKAYKEAYRAAYKKKEAEDKAKQNNLENLLKGNVKDTTSSADSTGTSKVSGAIGYTVVGDPQGNTYITNGADSEWIGSGNEYNYVNDENNNYQWWNPFTWF